MWLFHQDRGVAVLNTFTLCFALPLFTIGVQELWSSASSVRQTKCTYSARILHWPVHRDYFNPITWSLCLSLSFSLSSNVCRPAQFVSNRACFGLPSASCVCVCASAYPGWIAVCTLTFLPTDRQVYGLRRTLAGIPPHYLLSKRPRLGHLPGMFLSRIF